MKPNTPIGVSHSSPRVAVLFTNRWAEAAVADSLEKAGMTVQKYPHPLALVAALHLEAMDIAVIEDHETHLAGCMAALRFRGTTTVPIVAVGRGTAAQIATALMHGVSDYAVLGEAMDTLVNRVRARVEVCQHREEPDSIEFGMCVLDAQTRTLKSPVIDQQLTWRECSLAWLLFEHAGQVVSLHTISIRVWGRDVSVTKRTIEQHMSRLRRKLAIASGGGVQRLQVHAVNNVGYRLVLDTVPIVAEEVRTTASHLALQAAVETLHAKGSV